MEIKNIENSNHQNNPMSIDVQYANEHYAECINVGYLKKYNLPNIRTYKEFAALSPQTKKEIRNLIHLSVISSYVTQHSGNVSASKIKVIARNGKTAVWCFAIRRGYRDKLEYKLFDCANPIWNKEVNQW